MSNYDERLQAPIEHQTKVVFCSPLFLVIGISNFNSSKTLAHFTVFAGTNVTLL